MHLSPLPTKKREKNETLRQAYFVVRSRFHFPRERGLLSRLEHAKAEVSREREAIFPEGQIPGSGHSISECDSNRQILCRGPLPAGPVLPATERLARRLSGTFAYCRIGPQELDRANGLGKFLL